jgi:NitT/TauT family transport system substrate-binding protein
MRFRDLGALLACALLVACAPAGATSRSAPTSAPATVAPVTTSNAGAQNALPTLATPNSPIAVTVIWTAVTGANGPLWTAYEEGYFKQQGLDVTLTNIASTSRAIAAILAGEAQFANTDPSTLVAANAEGGDLRLIAALTNRLVFSVMAQPTLATPQDLRGKSMGITRAGSSTYTAALQALKIWNLKPDSDVTLVPLDQVPSILAGLQANQVAAGVVSPPTSIQARDAGYKTLIDLARDGPDFPSVGISTTESMIQKDPDTVRRFVRGYALGLQRFMTDKQTAMADMNKYLQLSDQGQLAATWQDFSQYLADPPEVPDAGMQAVIADASTAEPKVSGTSPADYVDMRFIKELEPSGIFTK